MNDNHIFGVNTKPSPQLNSTDGCKDFSPLPWDAYFDKKLKIKNSPDSIDTFTVYTAGVNDGKNPIFVFVHGAGHTALSFALTARKLKNFFFCAAFDMRGHGETEVADHQNFELDTLAEDAVKIVQAVSRNGQYVVLVGHSLGGAVAVRCAKKAERKLNIRQIAVIDLVEGTAMAALPLMEGILREQPVSFVNCKAAVEWAMCSGGHSRCLEAVRVSMPSRLRETNDGLLGWRTDLFGTEKFWRGWFTNLSNDLLELKATKLLILAHTDRLDRTMTIGQMQGLFQLEVLLGAGHEVHENRSDDVAEILKRFVERNLAAERLNKL